MSPTPGVVTPLVLTSYGGEVVRDGVIVRAVNHDVKTIRDGVYLLFLKNSADKPGLYRIYHAAAFELSSDGVKPIAIQGEDLFRDFSGPYSQILARIVAAASAR